MAQDQGGATGSICEISPSDLAGNVANLVTRIKTLEQIVAQLQAENVSADQLSDFSESLGWVTNVTFLGTEGWTQTPYGTLIPPAGWTGLSSILDGNTGLTIYGAGGLANILTVYYQDTSTDLASGSDTFINPTSTSSVNINKGDTGLVQGSLGGGAKTGWQSERSTNYIVFAQLYAIAGTGVPTSGYINTIIYNWRETSDVGGYSGIATGMYPVGTSVVTQASCILASAFVTTSATIDQGFIFRVGNKTNGDIRISELRATFIKV